MIGVGDKWVPLESVKINEKDAARDLELNYQNPAHPLAFMGIDKIYKYYNGKLSKSHIKLFLSSVEVYSLMKQEKTNLKKIWTPVISFHYLDLGMFSYKG